MDATIAATTTTTTTSPQPPSVGELFTGFLWLGMTGFGGVLPMSRRMIVEKKRWLTGAEFTDLLASASSCPAATSSTSRWPSACIFVDSAASSTSEVRTREKAASLAARV
eukprot:gene42449-57467_t